MIRMVATPSHCSQNAFDHFVSALLQLDATEGLFHAASAIAMHAFDDLEWQSVSGRLDHLEQSVRNRLTPETSDSVSHRVAHLHQVLFHDEGFGGADRLYALHNFVPQVMELKEGSPEVLCLIYKVIAERLGLSVEGVRLPHRLVVRVGTDEGAIYVDPHQRRMLSPSEAQAAASSAAVTHQQWLTRLLGNVQAMFATDDRALDLAAMLELQALVPD